MSAGSDMAGHEGSARRARPGAVLFVCGMNAIRSPMAEALARAILPAGTYVASAGVRPGERDPFVDAVLAEKGLALGDHRPRHLDDSRTAISMSSSPWRPKPTTAPLT